MSTNTPDFLARPQDPSASNHRVPPSPRYCLRETGGKWYLIPLIYEWGFERYCAVWIETESKAILERDGIISGVPYPGPKDVPRYAIPVNLGKFSFEKPIELPE